MKILRERDRASPSRRTGAPTGCTAKPRPCSRSGRSVITIRPTRRSTPQRANRSPRACAPRCARTRTTRRPARSRSRTIAQSRSTIARCALRQPFRQRSRRPRSCRSRPMRCATIRSTRPSIAAKLTAFFFWTAWAAVTDRPGETMTYTNNWPYEPLVGNTPTPVDVPLVGVQRAVPDRRHRAARPGTTRSTRRSTTRRRRRPRIDPLRASRRRRRRCGRRAKYFWVVLRAVPGADPARRDHRALQVEGHDFYGFPLSNDPAVFARRAPGTRSSRCFWIATAWLATGLYIAPAISGHEPKFQRLGVNFLFVCLLVIVVGSFAGQWFAVMQKLGLAHELLVRPPGLRVRRPRAASGRSSCSSACCCGWR